MKPKTKKCVRRADQARWAGSRNYQAYVTIGGKGIGKTTIVMDDIDEYLERFEKLVPAPMGPRAIIHDYSSAFDEVMTVEEWIWRLERKVGKKAKYEHPLEMLTWKDKKGYPLWKKGALRYCSKKINPDIRLFHEMVFTHVKNAFVVMDECSVYFKSEPPEWQRLLMYNHRNMGLELMYIFHKLRKVPLMFVEGDEITSFRVFKTGEATTEEYKKKLAGRYGIAEQLWEAHVKAEKAPARKTKSGQLTRTQHYELVTRKPIV